MSMQIVSIGVFSLLMLYFAVWHLLSLWRGSEQPKDFKSIIVSTGVLGTFFGISVGLWNFDENDIVTSVPLLLGGLKIAFITSVIGMGLMVGLSVIEKWKGFAGDDSELKNAINDLGQKLTPLVEIQQSVKQLDILPLMNTKLDSIDSNIKTTLQENQEKLILFLREKLETIDASLKEAVQTLARGATEEIIKALESVISDFNKNLTEQFGDNFKQLNESVQHMIAWQENYKSQVQAFEKSLQETLASVQTANASMQEAIAVGKENVAHIKSITEDYQAIATISGDLKAVIQTNQQQISNLETHLESLKQVGEDAGGIVTQLKEFSNTIQGSLTEQSKVVGELSQQTANQLADALRKLEESLASLSDKFAEDYNAFLNKYREMKQAENG